MSEDDGPPVDLRLLFPAAAAWAGAGIGISGGRWAGLAIGLGFLGAVAGWRWRAWTSCAVSAALLAAGVVAWGWSIGLSSSVPATWAAQGAVVDVRARVASDVHRWKPRAGQPSGGVLSVQVERMAARGQVWQGDLPASVFASGAALEALDQPVGATVSLLALAKPPKPGERSVAALALRSAVVRVAEPKPAAALANKVRSGLRDAMALSTGAQEGLVPSLVVGDVSALPPEVEQDFKTTGLSHLTAVSGTNLTLMLAFCLGLARQVGVRGWWLRVTGLVVVLGFVVVCRAEPSVLRAAAMGLVALAATGFARDRRRGLRALCLAVLVLVLVDPWLARSWGFSLSVCASAGILWWGTRWQTLMGRWAPGWLAESLAIPMAAQLATQPLITHLSGQISAVGLVANVACGPFVGPVTVLGLAAALSSVISPPLALALGWVAGWCVQPILLVASVGADLPAASWRWPPTASAIGLLAVGCWLLAQVVLPWILARRAITALLLLSLPLGVTRQPPQPGWPGDWVVVACDVGQGGAQIIRVDRDSAILVDAGPDPTALRACLSSLGVTDIPLLVITHQHADHVGGIDAVVDRLAGGMVLVGPSPTTSDEHTPAWLRRLGAVVTTPGDVVHVGDVRWTTLAAGPVAGSLPATGVEDPSENDAGVVGMIESRQLRVLVTGDLEVLGQQAVLGAAPGLQADVLIVPHHGSARQDQGFIRAVGASVALIQVGEDNDYGHPAASTVRMLEASGATVFRTDRHGAVAVLVGGRTVLTQR